MTQPWIKLWKNDLLTSSNYKSLHLYEKGVYNVLLLVCRDDEYAGEFCWPNGNAMNVREIVSSMGPKERDRTDLAEVAIENLVKKGMLFWNKRKILEIRKYKEKTKKIEKPVETSGVPVETSGVPVETSGVPVVEQLSHSGVPVETSRSKNFPESQGVTVARDLLQNQSQIQIQKKEEGEREPTGGIEDHLLKTWNTGNQANPISHEKGVARIKAAILRGADPAKIEQAFSDPAIKAKYKIFEVLDGLGQKQEYGRKSVSEILEEMKTEYKEKEARHVF